MNLDEFITKLSEDGDLESAGVFSVDSLAALRKTLSSALPKPHYCIFQVLQGLIRGGATDIKVSIGRQETKITFADPKGQFHQLETLEAKLDSALSVASPDPLDLLISGLATSLGSEVSTVDFSYESQSLRFSLEQTSLTALPSPVKVPCLTFERALQTGLSFSWSKVWGARKEEFRIRKAFEYSPTPISIAGLPTSPRSNWRRRVDGEEHFVLLEAALLDSVTPNHCAEPLGPTKEVGGGFQTVPPRDNLSHSSIAPTLLALALDSEGKPLMELEQDSDWNRRRWSFSFTSADVPGSITWVRNGLSIEHHAWNVGFPGIHVVAPADDLMVDASGYKLIQNQNWIDRTNLAQTLVHTIVNLVAELDLEAVLRSAGHDVDGLTEKMPWMTQKLKPR